MLTSEFFNLHQGKLVRLNREYTNKDSYTTLTWEGWEGIITGYNEGLIFVNTTKKDPSSNASKECHWSMDRLVLIEPDLDIIMFPTNIHLCPRCKKDECKGMDIIECLLKEIR